MSAFLSYQDELSSCDIDLHASELHGMLIGYLCAVKKASNQGQRASLYREWICGELPASLAVLLETSYRHTLENLGEYADFDFSLAIPDDSSPIEDRVKSIALWSGGFLSGYGEAGRHQDVDSKSDVKEALQDLARIAAMSDEVPEGEENETDLVEIVEFVRISALLIFSETASPGAH